MNTKKTTELEVISQRLRALNYAIAVLERDRKQLHEMVARITQAMLSSELPDNAQKPVEP